MRMEEIGRFCLRSLGSGEDGSGWMGPVPVAAPMLVSQPYARPFLRSSACSLGSIFTYWNLVDSVQFSHSVVSDSL